MAAVDKTLIVKKKKKQQKQAKYNNKQEERKRVLMKTIRGKTQAVFISTTHQQL